MISRKRFGAILKQRCPVCLEGRVFRVFWHMNPNCPQCGIQFEREAGYFLGAMYYSYGMSGLSLIPLGVITWIYDPPVWFIGGVAILQAVILTPVFFRYSRVLWLHMDQRFDPR